MEAGGHVGGRVAVTVEMVIMSVHVGIQTLTLGRSPLTPILALALPNCVNMGEGHILQCPPWLSPEGLGSIEDVPNQVDSGPFRTNSQAVGSVTLSPPRRMAGPTEKILVWHISGEVGTPCRRNGGRPMIGAVRNRHQTPFFASLSFSCEQAAFPQSALVEVKCGGHLGLWAR